jgi:hypothetical protein
VPARGPSGTWPPPQVRRPSISVENRTQALFYRDLNLGALRPNKARSRFRPFRPADLRSGVAEAETELKPSRRLQVSRGIAAEEILPLL